LTAGAYGAAVSSEDDACPSYEELLSPEGFAPWL
jgi:hypothetical protein